MESSGCTACRCLRSNLPCRIEEAVDPYKDYGRPLSIDTSLQYSLPGSEVADTASMAGGGLLMMLVAQVPDVAVTQTVVTTTVIQGGQGCVPNEDHYDPYIGSRLTELRPLSHDLYLQDQGHQRTHTPDMWATQLDALDTLCEGQDQNIVPINNSQNIRDCIPTHQNNVTDSNFRVVHHNEAVRGQHPVMSKQCTDSTDRYWEYHIDHNMPDYDILSQSLNAYKSGLDYDTLGQSLNGKSGFEYDILTQSLNGKTGLEFATHSQIPCYTRNYGISGDYVNDSGDYLSTSCYSHSSMDQRYVNSMDIHCGQVAYGMMEPTFFKSNIYAEEWLMNL